MKQRLIVVFVVVAVGWPGCVEGPRAQERLASTLTTLRTGDGPTQVAATDLNQDGNIDLVVANGRDGSATVYLGDGTGQFREVPDSPFPAGNEPGDVAVGDFDRNGTPDLAFANHETDYVTVLLGVGDGRFAPAPFSPVPVRSQPHPHGIATADFDLDGRADLVVESFREDVVEVLWGDSLGGFATPGSSFSVGRLPYQRVRTGDVNGDGRAAIVTTNREGASVSILLAVNRRGFTEAPASPLSVPPSPFGHALGQLNGDSCLDLVVAHYSGSIRDRSRDRVSILLGDCEGGFEPVPGSPFSTGVAPTTAAIGDVNGDGLNDVAVACYGSDEVQVFIATGDGRFETKGLSISVGKGPLAIVAADLDGDGKSELITANNDSADVTVIDAQ
jgi:hypothetical protein